MVNIVFTVMSLAVLVIAVVTRGQNASSLQPQENTNVLSATNAPALPETNPVETPLATTMATSVSLFPTATASATPKAIATPTPISHTSTSEWIYVGPISEKSVTDRAVSFTTSDTPKLVTAWYKENMTALGFVPKSVIQTQSNTKILNKLAGTGVRGNVSIEITEDSEDSPTHVTVTLDTNAVAVNNLI